MWRLAPKCWHKMCQKTGRFFPVLELFDSLNEGKYYGKNNPELSGFVVSEKEFPTGASAESVEGDRGSESEQEFNPRAAGTEIRQG